MPIEITMPRLSDTMEEGTLIKWRVGVGDKVASGDHLADVETDKATMELQAFDDGTVAQQPVGEGDVVPVGDLILLLAEDGESAEDAIQNAGASGGGEKKSESSDQATEAASSSDDGGGSSQEPEPADSSSGGGGGAGRIRVSPLARKLAEEHDLDLSTIQGSGPDGRIIKRDVLAAAKGDGGQAAEPAKPQTASTPPTPVQQIGASGGSPEGGADSGVASGVASGGASGGGGLEAKSIPVSGMRKTIAKRLVESKTQVPHFQVSVAISMDALLELRQTINGQLESQGIKLSVNDFITRGVALACLEHPVINSSWAGDSIEQHGAVNVGIAMALPPEKGGGLLVATVRDVDRKGLRQISSEVKTLAKNARGEKGLTVEQMSDSTITISNLGMPQYGVTQFTAIVNPPNAAIIAVGAAIEKPVVRDGQIVVGHEMNVTLSGDHRVIDGASAAEYLATLRRLLENPAALLV
jgi:pyruvate dehydrogenase E2 component (dihydrolipoamide acetyltransferase)